MAHGTRGGAEAAPRRRRRESAKWDGTEPWGSSFDPREIAVRSRESAGNLRNRYGTNCVLWFWFGIINHLPVITIGFIGGKNHGKNHILWHCFNHMILFIAECHPHRLALYEILDCQLVREENNLGTSQPATQKCWILWQIKTWDSFPTLKQWHYDVVGSPNPRAVWVTCGRHGQRIDISWKKMDRWESPINRIKLWMNHVWFLYLEKWLV